MIKTYQNPNRDSGEIQKPVMIFDLDGTLSNDAHRIKLWQEAQESWKDYDSFGFEVDRIDAEAGFDAYHKQSALDLPNYFPMMIFKEALNNPNFEVWVLTGRPKAYRHQTMTWLFPLFPDCVFMRENGDTDPSWSIKEQLCLFNIPKRLLSESIIIDNDPLVIEALSVHMNVMLFKQLDHHNPSLAANPEKQNCCKGCTRPACNQNFCEEAGF